MKPTLKLAEAVNAEGEVVELFSHDGNFRLQAGRVTLRSTQWPSSEEELGRLGTQPFLPCRKPRILVAGLGLGFVLRGVLDALEGRRAEIVVAEPMAPLISWHHDHLRELHGERSLLEDPRVRVENCSADEILWGGEADLHSILIPLDGPPSDSMLLGEGGLAASMEVLRDGGLVGVLAPVSDRSLETRMKNLGYRVSFQQVKASAKARKGRLDSLWLATKPGEKDYSDRPPRGRARDRGRQRGGRRKSGGRR